MKFGVNLFLTLTSVMTPLGLTSAVMDSWVTPTGLDSIKVLLEVVCSSFSWRWVEKDNNGSL